jgi:hypothetical protein
VEVSFFKGSGEFFFLSDRICLSPNSVFLYKKLYLLSFLFVERTAIGKREAIMEVHIVRGFQTKVNDACGNLER